MISSVIHSKPVKQLSLKPHFLNCSPLLFLLYYILLLILIAILTFIYLPVYTSIYLYLYISNLYLYLSGKQPKEYKIPFQWSWEIINSRLPTSLLRTITQNFFKRKKNKSKWVHARNKSLSGVGRNDIWGRPKETKRVK